MPSRKKGLARSPISFLIAVHLLFCFQAIPHTGYAEVKKTTPVEVEDRDLIHHLLKDGYTVYAREEADEYLGKYPNGIFRAEIIYVLAEISVVEKKLITALGHYDTILTQHPDSELYEDALYLSGALHLELEQNTAGRKKLRQLIQKYPQSRFLFRTYFKLGELAFKEKNWVTAETYLKTTVENGDLKPAQQLEAENYLAWVYYFQNRRAEAVALFQNLLKSNLSNAHKAKMAYQFAIDAQKESHFRDAIKWHERLIKEWPHPDFIEKSRFWIAESLFLLNQVPEQKISNEEKKRAIQLFSQNLKLKKPIEPENSHYHRGWFLLDLGRDSEAETDFSWLQRHHEKYRKNIELTIIRGRHHETKKAWRTANRIYTAALKLQDSARSKNQLLAGIIRNNYRQKKCSLVIRDYYKITLPFQISDSDEIHYYAGTCLHDKGKLKKAARVFSTIDTASRFAPLSLDYHMDALRQTRGQTTGVVYLERVRNLEHFKDKERILLYTTEFYLDLEQWFKALTRMKELVGISPGKKKDPWFLLNLARTLDQIVISMKDKQWRMERPTLKTEKYYKRQAIIYYREAYKYMPIEEKAVRLSILDILIKHHETKKAWKTLVYQYQTAIKLSNDDHQKAQYTYRLATILIKTGGKKDRIISLLEGIHGSADTEVNYRASTLLAELYIGKQHYDEAIDTLIDLAQQPINNTQWYPKVHFRLGELYQAREKWLASIKHYSKVVNSKQKGGRKKEARERLFKIKKFVSQSQAAKKSKSEKGK